MRAESFATCRALTRHHAKSFYFASHALPPSKRQAAYALYAYCREVDDRVDLAPDVATQRAAVTELRTWTQGILAGTTPAWPESQPWGLAFVETVQERRIPHHYFDDLLTGVEMDLAAVRLQTWPELERYCYHVASVVGLMMTHVLTEPHADLLKPAKDLGTAMQLTNILRDVAEDWTRDRIYLPAEELREFGVSMDDWSEGRGGASARRLMQFQIERAREYYRRAEVGIHELPRDGSQWCVWMMREIYAEILAEIEKVNYTVWAGRVRVGLARKCGLAIKAWRRAQGVGKL
jgi:phytoene synthase